MTTIAEDEILTAIELAGPDRAAARQHANTMTGSEAR
jgi:hypothetical protein